MILAYMLYAKGSKKPKNKGKNPYYIRDNVASDDADPVSIELGKTTHKCWTCRGPHY